MNRKFFWLGNMLAVGALLWILWRQRRDEVEEILERVRQTTPRWEGALPLKRPLTRASQKAKAVKRTPSPASSEEPSKPKEAVDAAGDDLQQINGIGPAYARRLQEAGITRFAQLAALGEQDVRDRLQLEAWRGDVASWIDQARDLSG